MTEQTGGIGIERQALPLTQRLTWARALLSQSVSELMEPPSLPAERSRFYLEIGNGSPQIRALGDPDSVEADNAGLDVMASLLKDGAVDIVLAEASCIDLNFYVPPGPLKEVRGMIASEISFKSPFAEDATLAFWQAHEAPDHGWRVRAAVTLKDPVLQMAEQLQQANLTVASVVREFAGGELRCAPPWEAQETAPKPSPVALFRRLAPSMRTALLGAAILTVSATAYWAQTTLRDWSLTGTADAARAELSASARATARLRGLDTAIAQSTEVLAITGEMSALLPDGVWLDQIIVDGQTVTLVGFGPSAADVTRLLATVPALSDVQFASPVVRDNSQSIERFRISAVLQPGPAQ